VHRVRQLIKETNYFASSDPQQNVPSCLYFGGDGRDHWGHGAMGTLGELSGIGGRNGGRDHTDPGV
jgi:hypothetical protein